MKSCPKCEFDLPAEDLADCPACGIVIEKYLARAAPDPPAPTLVEDTRFVLDPAPGRTITWATLDAFASAGPWIGVLITANLVQMAALLGLGAFLVFAGRHDGILLAPGIVYLLIALGILVVLLPLRRSMVALRELPEREPSAALEAFAIHHASFWHRAGVLTALGLLVGGVALIAMLVGAL